MLLVFSDGVDDNIEVLEYKSEELKKRGTSINMYISCPKGFSVVNENKIFEFETQAMGKPKRVGRVQLLAKMLKDTWNLCEIWQAYVRTLVHDRFIICNKKYMLFIHK